MQSAAKRVIFAGAGPAGSATALELLQRGMQPVIVERETFPRFHIGESLTGETGMRLRALGLEDDLNRLQYQVKYGTQVFGRGGNSHFKVPVMKRELGELLPMTTWQVERSTFDALLLSKALERGATRIKGYVGSVKQLEDGRIFSCTVIEDCGNSEQPCDYFIDATGQVALLSTQDVVGEKEHGRYSKQIAIYAHMEGIHTLDTRDTTIFYREKYHWSWYIPITKNKISVGIVVPSDYFKQSLLTREEFFEREIQSWNPRLTDAVSTLNRCSDVRASSNYSYTIEKYTGPNYLCVGDAHKFIDPIFSYGVHFALHEGGAAAEAIAASTDGKLDVA